MEKLHGIALNYTLCGESLLPTKCLFGVSDVALLENTVYWVRIQIQSRGFDSLDPDRISFLKHKECLMYHTIACLPVSYKTHNNGHTRKR